MIDNCNEKCESLELHKDVIDKVKSYIKKGRGCKTF